MGIFLILTLTWQGEDNSGRDIETYQLNADEDGNDGPGYFTRRRDAQAWIDRQDAKAREKYEAALVEWEKKQADYESLMVKHREGQAELRLRAKELGIDFYGHSGPTPPRKPFLSTDPKYRILEIEAEPEV